jgi:hypothetical protein
MDQCGSFFQSALYKIRLIDGDDAVDLVRKQIVSAYNAQRRIALATCLTQSTREDIWEMYKLAMGRWLK